jgi:hypothetical protein
MLAFLAGGRRLPTMDAKRHFRQIAQLQVTESDLFANLKPMGGRDGEGRISHA